MMGGRPRKARRVREAEGNRGHRPMNDEPTPEKRISFTPPAHLDQGAKVEWRRLVKELQKQEMVTAWDWAMFASYCANYSRIKKAEAELKKQTLTIVAPNGVTQKNPLVTIIKEATALMTAAADRLGLNPKARPNLNVKKAATDGKSEADREFGF